MRIVADTNTVVSAFLWGGLPAEVLSAARAQRITLFTSATLLAELEDVLTRDKHAARIRTVGSTPLAMLTGYRALTTLVRAPAIAPVSRDPDDDQVLACALAAQAQLIVTRDKDLLVLKSFQGINIVDAREALERIEAAK